MSYFFLLVGNAGCGKTVLINDKLASLNEDWLAVSVPFNFYTTSEMLQSILEKPLEKKAGRNYGPPGSKKIIYFIDDMNMPEVKIIKKIRFFFLKTSSFRLINIIHVNHIHFFVNILIINIGMIVKN
jgi:hypothetical protein